MLRKLVATTAVLAVASAAFAQSVAPTIGVEQVPSANPDLFIIDVSQTTDTLNGDGWTVGGIHAHALNGATIVYALDPNTGVPVLTATDPAGDGRDVTMVSKPRAQNANTRFRPAGATDIVGAYLPTGPSPVSTSTFANIAFADLALASGSGYISRVAINVSGTAFTVAELEIVLSDPGAAAVLHGDAATASGDFPTLTTIEFWVVPEPASLALLVIGGLIAFRRR